MPTDEIAATDEELEMTDEIDVTECLDCGEKGAYEARVLINGRGFYACPNGHRWQDAREKPSNKGVPFRG